MSVDRTKILEAAQKHLAKGAYDKAIAEFQKLVKADPADVRTWLKIGDLYAKKGATKEAVDTYARVADQYSTQGFFLKAVAVHKQILKLDPSRLDVQLRLADAYENLQLVSDALNTYEQVATQYVRAGNMDKALSTLSRMVDLDPSNIPVRIKYAEGLSKANRMQEAASAFEAGGELLRAQGRIDDWMKVAERLLFHRPEDIKVARELSRLYLERNDAKRALPKLQVCFKADPRDIPTLEMLAEAFHQLGQLPKTISVYREIARLHHDAARPAERAKALAKILKLDPNDAEARENLAGYAPPEPAPRRRDIAPPPSAVVARSATPASVEEEVEELDEDEVQEEVLESIAPEPIDSVAPEAIESVAPEALGDDFEEEPEDTQFGLPSPVLGASRPKVPPRPAENTLESEPGIDVDVDEARPASVVPLETRASSLPPDLERDARIAKLMTECQEYRRYGLLQKVQDRLRLVLDLAPTNIEAREQLKDLLVEQGEFADAIDELFVLADLFGIARPSLSALYLREVLELDPNNVEARTRLSELGMSATPAPRSAQPTAPESPEFNDDTNAEGTGGDDIFFLDEDARSERPQAMVPPPPAESDSLEAPLPLLPSLRAAAEPQVERSRVPPPAAIPSAHLPSPAPADDPLAPMSPEEFESAPVAKRSGRSSLPGSSFAPGEVEELLDEADFYVAQGLFEEAKAMLADALAAHPKNRLLEDKLQEVDELAAAQPTPRSIPPADQSFALAERLAEDLDAALPTPGLGGGSDELDVESVFAQFKKGVEQQVGLEDSETHFDLGIAYKEMELLSDAIAEFRLCLSNPRKECIAHTMIGLCLLEKRDLEGAISHFKKGLYAEHKTDREELGLYYELGSAYELLHDPKEALYYFEKVKKRDPNFRGVNERIAALVRPAEAAPNSGTSDDLDAAFDDLLGDKP